MAELRSRKSVLAGSELADDLEPDLILDDHEDALVVHRTRWSQAKEKMRKLYIQSRHAFLRLRIFFQRLYAMMANRLDGLAGLLVGNNMTYVPSDDPSVGERVILWCKEKKRTFATLGIFLMLTFCAIYVALAGRALLSERGHFFALLKMRPAAFLSPSEIPKDFSCACRDLTGTELMRGIVFQSDPDSLADTAQNYASVDGVLAANAALLDVGNDFGCLMAMPKIWNTSSSRDLYFLEGAHRFNPCIVTVDTVEHGRLEMINPILLNDDTTLRDNMKSISLEKIWVKEALRVFDFLSDGIEYSRYKKIILRYRTPPHLEIVKTLELDGLDAIIVQSALQMLRDGYAEIVRKVIAAEKRALKADAELQNSGQRLRFQVGRAGVSYEYGIV